MGVLGPEGHSEGNINKLKTRMKRLSNAVSFSCRAPKLGYANVSFEYLLGFFKTWRTVVV